MRQRGFTLIEVVVGTALMLIIFIGVFGLIQLGFRMVGQAKARVTATALANEKIELARNIAYGQVGTLGGIPAGSIPETETLVRNRVSYEVKTTVVYIDDPFDGTESDDPLALDYKRVKVKVTWTGFLGGSVTLQTDVAPKGIESTGEGGTISILVFNANGEPVPQADVHVTNNIVSPPIDASYQTNAQGQLFLPGAPAGDDCYNISVTKIGFSTDRTYASGELVRGVALASPAKPPISVILNETSETSFSIDRLSSKTVRTLRYTEEKNWGDSFDDESKISEKNQVVASSTISAMILDEQSGQYLPAGYLVSQTIAPTSLVEWGRLNWNNDLRVATGITYQVLYLSSGVWILVPDSDLTVNGQVNSEGFSSAPVDLSGLDASKYPSLRIKANFTTSDLSITPVLSDWQVTWFSFDTALPVAGVNFSMVGIKSLGTDASGQPVYKYKENLATDSSGQKSIENLEWDSYTITVGGASGYDIANSSPSQPVAIGPNTSAAAVLKLANHQAHTLLVTVQDPAGNPLVGSSVRLYRSGYDKSKLTSDSGQVFFSPLSNTAYTLEVKTSGYQDRLLVIAVSGQKSEIVTMTTP